MAERDVILYDSREAARLMDTGTVLNIHAVAYTYSVHVCPENCPEPYGTIIAHRNVPDERSIL
jgi:hypothetical protein